MQTRIILLKNISFFVKKEMTEFRGTNYRVSNESRNLTITGRNTIPLGVLSQTPVQRPGSLIFDPRTLGLYYSD
jgi:hypothetical protein